MKDVEPSIPILDFSKGAGSLDSFSQEEKEQILDEYNEAISELGALNDYSLEWLCHPISEKNDLAPDTLLDRLIDFLTFYRFISKTKTAAVVISAQRPALARDIMDFARTNTIECRCEYESIKSEARNPKSETNSKFKCSKFKTKTNLRRGVKKIILLVKGAIQQQYWFMKCRFLWKQVDENKTYTVIRTWFDGRSRALMENDKDIYFGRLPGFLKKNGIHVLYFGEFAYGFEHEFGNITKGLEDPVILGRSLLNGWDFVKGFGFRVCLLVVVFFAEGA